MEVFVWSARRAVWFAPPRSERYDNTLWRARASLRAAGNSHRQIAMARWPRRTWTTVFTYGAIFVLFPILCLLAVAWVNGWLF
jgi:hypothetical protein